MIARRKNVPPIPQRLNDLENILQEYRPMRDIFRGPAYGTDGSLALIFIHNDMMQPLSQCTQLFCDGTFTVNDTSIVKKQTI